MKIIRITLIGAGVLLAGAVALVAVLLVLHEDLSPFDKYFVGSEPAGENTLSVRYMGNTNLLVTDGTTSLMVDGWFTRPSTLSLLIGKIEPDMDAISNGLARGEVGSLDAVIPVHSHFDHAMDAPEVARRTGALLVGSESTANIGRGWGLLEDQIRTVVSGEPLQFGAFTVTLIKSRHFEFPNPAMRAAALDDPVIAEPLVPPVAAMDYKMGGAYSIHIEHPLGSILVQGSAGYVTGALDGLRADVVFLGVGGLAAQTEAYQREYWEQIVRVVHPTRVFPVHWDSLTDPLADEPVMPSLLWSRVLDFQARAGIAYAIDHANEDGLDAALLPMWQNVVLFREPR